MSHKYDTLPWRLAVCTNEGNRCVMGFAFGPLVKTLEYKTGQLQPIKKYYDHQSKLYRTEAALISHMNYLAREGN